MTLVTGDTLPTHRTHALAIADFVRYQGASGDLNPIHHDPDAARAAGFDSVFCPGMLSAGLLAAHLTNTLGVGRVREIGFSFREIVWPGEVLTCSATVTAAENVAEGRELRLELACARPDGSIAVRGDAVYLLEATG